MRKIFAGLALCAGLIVTALAGCTVQAMEPLQLAQAAELPAARDARDALAVQETTIRVLADTALAAVRTSVFTGPDATALLTSVRGMRAALLDARGAVLSGDPGAQDALEILDGTVAEVAAHLQAKGVMGGRAGYRVTVQGAGEVLRN